MTTELHLTKRVHIMDREEEHVREAICVQLENPSLNRGGCLRHSLSPIYNDALFSIPRKIRTSSLVQQDGHTYSHHLGG